MTLDEAARWTPPESPVKSTSPTPEFYQRPREKSSFANAAFTQKSAEDEKREWKAALDRAKERGLDKAEEAKKAAQEAANAQRRNSKAKRNPAIHAQILLKETSLPFEEIADITGLDVYQIVGMKLKSRSAA